MINKGKFRIEKRDQVGVGFQILALFIALLASAIVTAILINSAGADIREGFIALYEGAFGNWKKFSESLVKATPLIFTGLATVIAFQGRVWNIGQEGQLYAGAMMAYWVYFTFGDLPPGILYPLIFLGGIIGGALWGLIPAVIKARYDVDVIITTVMLNYIILYILSWFLSGPWRDPASYYQQTTPISESMKLPVFVEGTRLHIGILVALVSTAIIYILLKKSPLGYEIRAFGSNLVATKFQGFNTTAILIICMVISGALAGLAGTSELFGIHQRLKADISLGYGYTGIIIAMLAGLEPIAVILAAIFFGGLINGAFFLQITTGVPAALVQAIQAIVLLFLLSSRAIVGYRIRRVADDN
jgi:ABC-type uncharacterized transport system permease subunit